MKLKMTIEVEQHLAPRNQSACLLCDFNDIPGCPGEFCGRCANPLWGYLKIKAIEKVKEKKQ